MDSTHKKLSNTPFKMHGLKKSFRKKTVSELRYVFRQSTLDAAKSLAISRIMEQKRPDPVVKDPFSHFLLSEEEMEHAHTSFDANSLEHTLDVLCTRYLDDSLLQATSLTLPEHGDYRQVVLVTPGFDTRAFRLPWPRGTVIYDVAPQESHSIIKQQSGWNAPSGCLRVPVALDLQGISPFMQLERKGFRGDRLSVWALQGLHALQLTRQDIELLLVEISQLSKCKSLIFGELFGTNRSDISQLLSEFSLYGIVSEFVDEAVSFNRVIRDNEKTNNRFLFSCQQQMLSVKEQETYKAHVQAANEADEDFFDNIS